MRLLYGHDQLVSEWVEQRIPEMRGSFGLSASIGIVSENGGLMCGVVFHDYRPQYKTIQVSLAAVTPRWVTLNVIRSVLAYPFFQLGINKVKSAILHTNDRSIRFCKGIGFTQEATLKDEFGPGKHAVVCRLLAKDYHRLYGDLDGQKLTVAASAA